MDIIYLAKPRITVPEYSHSNYSGEGMSNYIQTLLNQGATLSGANSYTNGATVTASSYIGAVYSPTQNRIYFVPSNQGAVHPGNPNTQNWHYIDCNTGTVGTYLNPNISVSSAYFGGAYSPTQNRIYFAPAGQALPNSVTTTNWQYINCNDGTVGTYPNPNTAVTSAYRGAVYSPTQNRIYFVPASQATPYNGSNGTQYWHYIDCNTGAVGTYLNPNNASTTAYSGGVYSPTQNRIYFVPSVQAESIYPLWHYIDCNTGNVGTYANPGTAVNSAYNGGVYSPLQNRIYFIPRLQSEPFPANPNTKFWHYIDCNTGAVGTYLNPNTIRASSYTGGVYSPTQNRIYFVPREQAEPGNINTQNWHYIDCNTSTPIVGTYPNPNNSVTGAYIGGTYCPVQNRIYFTPYAVNTTWNFLDMQSSASTSKVLMSGAEYNKL